MTKTGLRPLLVGFLCLISLIAYADERKDETSATEKKRVEKIAKNEAADEVAKRVSFKRFSVEIPSAWSYSSNPQAKPGTDQVQIVSDDERQILLITLTDAREDVALLDATQMGGRAMISRVLSSPEYADCTAQGSGADGSFWGRNGVLLKFEIVKASAGGTKTVVMNVYNYGETLEQRKEVLFIVAFMRENDGADMEKIVKSMTFIENKDRSAADPASDTKELSQ